MAARPVNLTQDAIRVSAVRTLTNAGSAVGDDSATLTDANFPPAIDITGGLGGAINCERLSTIWIDAEFYTGTLASPVLVAPGSASLVLDMLARDDGAPDGRRWHRRRFGATTTPTSYLPVLDGSGFVEVRVDGSLCFPRVITLTGSATTVILIARPGAPLVNGRGSFPG